MGPVQFNINNETKYDLKIQASNGATAGAVAGASTQMEFTPDDTNITCAMRWLDIEQHYLHEWIYERRRLFGMQ